MSQSQFRMYSIGIVVETKPPGTDYILVTPMEELGIQDSGSIKDAEGTFKGNKESVSPTNFKTEHTSKNYVRAKWNGIGQGNRTSAPDVVAGETVILYKYGDVDEYFWDDSGREPSLRRLENILYSFSNVPGDIGGTPYDKSTSYHVEVSTRDKFLHIHTADNDGEACTFDVRIDTRAGIMTCKDSLGNWSEWDAPAGKHTQNFNTEILRMAPKITDISEFHTIKTDHYLNETSDDHVNTATTIHSSATVNITEVSPTIFNLAELATSHYGPDDIQLKATNILIEATEAVTSKAPTLGFVSDNHNIETGSYDNQTRDDMVNVATTISNTASENITDTSPTVDVLAEKAEAHFGPADIEMKAVNVSIEADNYTNKTKNEIRNESTTSFNKVKEKITYETPHVVLANDPSTPADDEGIKIESMINTDFITPELRIETPLIKLEVHEDLDEKMVKIEALGELGITTPRLLMNPPEKEDPNDPDPEMIVETDYVLSFIMPKLLLNPPEPEDPNDPPPKMIIESTRDLALILDKLILDRPENSIKEEMSIESPTKLGISTPSLKFSVPEDVMDKTMVIKTDGTLELVLDRLNLKPLPNNFLELVTIYSENLLMLEALGITLKAGNSKAGFEEDGISIDASEVSIKGSGGVAITAPDTSVTGNLSVSGELDAKLKEKPPVGP